MKRWWKAVLIALLALAWANPALADGFQDGQVVFGGSYTLRSGETLNGDLVVFGGNATVEAGATVDGNLAVVGGSAEVYGRVNGDLAVMGGTAFLGAEAVVEGDAVVMGGVLHRDEGARVLGQQVVEGSPTPFIWPGLNLPAVASLRVQVTPWWRGLWMLFRAFMLAALAMLVVLFFEQPTRRVAQTAVRQPVPAGGLGLLLLVLTPGTLLVLAITLILLPAALLLGFALALAALFGWLALGMEVGARLLDAFHVDWPSVAQAGLGTFALSFVTGGLDFIPCVGWIPGFLVLVVGLGAVALTRFGVQDYPQTVVAPVLPTTTDQEGEA